MGKFGQAAATAAKLASQSNSNSPRMTWETAALEVFPDSESSRKKGCPKDTFLALCGLGVVQNVKPGQYTRSIKNSSYAKSGLDALRNNPALMNDETGLWTIASGDVGKAHNAQMDVLITLVREGYIRGT
jgi:hypothetical protein